MPVLGITISPSAGRPRLSGVVLKGSREAPEFVSDFEIQASVGEPSEQAVDLARLLLAKLPGIEFQASAIRVAAPAPVARRSKALFSRAHAEGAVLFVLREHSQAPVKTGDPQSFARECGMKKDDLTALASSMSARKQDAALAALAMLPA